jgi:hypothetical protein
MKRRRSIPQALLRLRTLRAFDPAGASQPRGRLTRAVRRLRETILGVMPDAKDIDAANDSEK